MRQVYIFFKISNAQQCWFMHFVRFANMKLFCKSANENKNNFTFVTLTKHVNNQTNCYFGKIEENMDLSRIHLAVLEISIYHIKGKKARNSNAISREFKPIVMWFQDLSPSAVSIYRKCSHSFYWIVVSNSPVGCY